MSSRHLVTRISIVAFALCCWLLSGSALAQTLDACELDLDRKRDSEDCDMDERSSGWLRLGYPPAGLGLLNGGNLSVQLSVTPGAAGETRLARIQPTQPVVYMSLNEATATLIPDEWIDVVLVRDAQPDRYSVVLMHWSVAGLSSIGSPLASSAAFTQAGGLNFSVAWTLAQGQLTLNLTGPAGTSLSVQRSGFGTSLPWLTVPYFPNGNADLVSANLLGVSGSAQ